MCVGRVAVGDRPFIARIGEDFCFGRMHAAVRKFVMAADMVEMRVAGHANELSLRHQRDVAPQAEMAEAGVEQKIAIAAAHMPDVAAEERLDPWLVDQRHAIAHTDGFIPVRCVDNRKRAHGSARQKDDISSLARNRNDVARLDDRMQREPWR